MPYQQQFWRDYDENLTETQNIERGAVVTTERLNNIENGVVANYSELNSTKADKTALATTNATVEGLASSKVDKGGNEQITMGMLNQSVKEAMTGGSVAVVGAGGVNTTNLVDKAVTPAKLATSAYQVMLAGSKVAKYDSAANTLEIPSGLQAMQQNNSMNGTGVGITAGIIADLPNVGWLVFDVADKLIKLNNNPTATQSKVGYVWKTHVDGPKCVLFGIDVYVDDQPSIIGQWDNLRNGKIQGFLYSGKIIHDSLNKRAYFPTSIIFNTGFEQVELIKTDAEPSAGKYNTLPEYLSLPGNAGWILYSHKDHALLTGSVPTKGRTIIGVYDNRLPLLEMSLNSEYIQYQSMTSKIGFLGDSITQGVNTTKTYHQYIAENAWKSKIWVDAINYGIGGTTVATQSGRSDSFIERKDTVAEDCDVIVIFGGTNDYGASNALGAIDDGQENTFLGAYSLLIDWYHINRPNAKIICCTPLRRYYKGSTTVWKDAHTLKNSAGLTLQDYAEAVRDVAREKAVPVVDLYFESGLDFRLENIRTQYGADGLHPNAEGHKYFYPMILQKINQVFSK